MLSGDTLAIGSITDSSAAENAGAAYIFVLRSGRWTEQQRVQREPALRNAMFGSGLTLHGDTLAIAFLATIRLRVKRTCSHARPIAGRLRACSWRRPQCPATCSAMRLH